MVLLPACFPPPAPGLRLLEILNYRKNKNNLYRDTPYLHRLGFACCALQAQQHNTTSTPHASIQQTRPQSHSNAQKTVGYRAVSSLLSCCALRLSLHSKRQLSCLRG